MKINQWQHIQQHHSITALFILFVLMGSLTSHLAFFLTVNDPFQDDDVEVDSLTKNDRLNDIEKLEGRENSFSDPIQDSGLIDQDNRLVSNFAVGSQSGPGGGSVTIRDTFNWTGTIEMSTQNELSGGVPTTQTDSISITNSTSFNRQEGWFNISDVTATADWRLIENLDNTGRTPKDSDPDGDEFYEVAMSFNITEDWVNLTKVRIILDQNLLGNPEGELYIVNSTSGGDPDDTDILSESLTLLTTAVNWDTYTFTNPILLPNGTYFLVMNATVYDIDNFWKWYWQNDLSDDGSEDGIAYYKDFDHGTWTKWDPATIPLQIEVLPVYYNGSAYTNKTYQSPQELNFSYNTTEDDTELASFVWFDWNNTNSHTFQTETSVSFNLSFVSNYTYTPTINRFISYKTQNDSISYWNISFSVKAINQTYNIRNRHISILNIPDDWNGTKIYWNNSLEYPDIINDVNITWDGDSAHPYTHGNTSMVVNASTLQLNTTWNILLEAPNYLLAFNLSRGGKYLDFPYEANVTDTLGVNIQVSESGGNASYWIEDFNQQAIHNRTDFSSADFTDMWIIDDNVSQTININGSYDLQGFWISSDKTKVGTITRTLDVFINTTLTINSTDTIDVLIGDKITIWANYTSNHNSTINSPSHIDKAKIWCNASWPDGVKQNVSMNQPIGTYYNASFTTTNEDPGTSGTITIITQLPWFVNQSKTITINFVGKTNFAANQTNIDLKWRENTTLRVYFNDTSDNPVTSASIIIDGDTTHPAS